MPPKPSTSKGPSKKTEMKKKEKVIEDKTFGLKNKKGAKQQKFIQQVEKQVKFSNVAKVAEGKKKEEPDSLIKEIFKPVQKVEKGADPKSILCAFFKEGQCTKGDKCKFSHDLTIERKAEKRSLYCDMREDEPDTMETWDDDKLKDVVEKKHNSVAEANKTEIICKHFLTAVQSQKYGWFWECPSLVPCIYRHALPPGFQLKKDGGKKGEGDKENEVSLEDWIEKERNSLNSMTLTKVTMETFVAWKKRKVAERKEENVKAEEKKFRDFKAGVKMGLSGRDMFTFNPELAEETSDNEEQEEVVMVNIEESDEEHYTELNMDDYCFHDNSTTPNIENLEIDEDLFDDEI